MADLQVVGLFCLFYSGVVMYALWLTIAKNPAAMKESLSTTENEIAS